MTEENQNLGNMETTEGDLVSGEPKLEAVESVAEVAENDGQAENLAESVVDSPASVEMVAEEVIPTEQIENQTEEVEVPEVIETNNLPVNIENFKNLLSKKGENVSNVEMTNENYDSKGNLIKDIIPTIVTEYCEIGNYSNIIYFTFVIYSDSYNKNIFDLLQNFSNVQFYLFFDFKNTLYPKENFDYNLFEKEIIKEKYFQINFDYNIENTSLENLNNEYIKVKNIFQNSGVKIVNQLQVDLTKETQPIVQTQEIETPQTAEPIQQTQSEPQSQQTQTIEKIVYQTPPNLIQNLLTKARAKIQERKRKKLDKIMTLFETKTEVSNSEIQDLFRTTKRSATRYLNILEQEQKITQIGITGRGVKYTKKQ